MNQYLTCKILMLFKICELQLAHSWTIYRPTVFQNVIWFKSIRFSRSNYHPTISLKQHLFLISFGYLKCHLNVTFCYCDCRHCWVQSLFTFIQNTVQYHESNGPTGKENMIPCICWLDKYSNGSPRTVLHGPQLVICVSYDWWISFQCVWGKTID